MRKGENGRRLCVGKKCDLSQPKRMLSRMGERDPRRGLDVRESLPKLSLFNVQASADEAGGRGEDCEWMCNCVHV